MFEIEASTVVDQSSNKRNDFNFFLKGVDLFVELLSRIKNDTSILCIGAQQESTT